MEYFSLAPVNGKKTLGLCYNCDSVTEFIFAGEGYKPVNGIPTRVFVYSCEGCDGAGNQPQHGE